MRALACALLMSAVLLFGCGGDDPPSSPTRVVTLTPGALDGALALGMRPVGAAERSAGRGLPGYLDAAGIPTVGTVDRPDLEAIADLEPDAILGDGRLHEALRAELEQIAPTTLTRGNWRSAFRDQAAALRLAERATEVGADYELEASRLKSAGRRPRIVVVRGGPVRRGTFLARVLKDAGAVAGRPGPVLALPRELRDGSGPLAAMAVLRRLRAALAR